ncbi:MAG: sigma-70 factor domain-containing protein, partial [Chloroflexota bacterium]
MSHRGRTAKKTGVKTKGNRSFLDDADAKAQRMAEMMQAFAGADDDPENFADLMLLMQGAEDAYDDKPAVVRKLRARRGRSDEFDLSQISSDDTVGLYLKEMARVPLLTTEQEVDLAKRLERGIDADARLEQLSANAHKS